MAGQNFKISVDNDEVEKAFGELERDAKTFSNVMEKLGKKLDEAFEVTSLDEFKRAYKAQEDVVKSLSVEYEKMLAKRREFGDKLDEMGNTDWAMGEGARQYEKMSNEVTKIGNSLSESEKILIKQKNNLDLIEGEFKKINSQSTTYLTQMRKVREEMATLIDSDGTVSSKNKARYEELRTELGNLGTAYRRVQVEQKNVSNAGNAMIAGLTQGMQAIAGTFTLIQGISSAISGDSKDVAEVQRKLQQAMAITMGMQQLSTALHSTSQLRIGLVARATDMLTTAQTRLATALNISATSAKALMGALTLGVSVGIGLLISAYNKYSSKLEETRKRQEEVNQQYESQYSTVSRLIVKYNALRDQWIEIGNSLKDQNKFIADNKEEFKGLGKEITTVNDANTFLIDQTESYIKALTLRAEANANMALAEEAMTKKITANRKAQQRIEDVTFWDKVKAFGARTGLEMAGGYSREEINAISGVDYAKEASEELEIEANKQDKIAKDHIEQMAKLAKESQDIFKQLGVDFDIKKPKKEKKDTKAEKEQKSLEAQYIKFEKEKLEIEKLGLKDRLKLIEIEKKERIVSINKEKDDLLKINKDADTKIFDERLSLLDDFFNKKIQLEKDAITKENLEKLKEYQTLADRRLEIEKKYNDLIKIAEKEGQGQQVVDNIRKDMEKALSSFDFSALKSDLDLSYLFGDLSRISKSSIKSVIADLKKLRDANKNAWSIEELKIFNDKIKEAENLLATKSPFEVIKNSMTNISLISNNIEDKQREILELSKDELKNAEKLKKAKKELKELEDARASAIESTNKALNEIGQQGAEVISSLTNFMGTLEKFGVAFSDSMKESLSGLGQMFDAIASVDITKPASIVTGTINYVSGLGNLVAGLFSSSNDLTQAQVDSYNKYIRVVDDVINKQNELLRNTTGTSTMDLSRQIEKNINAQIKETQDIASKYLSSKRGGKFSGGNWREADANLKKYREEMKALGYDIDSVQKELIKLTPKELEHIRDNMHEMWSGFDDELSGWLDDIIAFGDRLDQLERDRKEALTGVSFDSLKNSLNELAKQADLTFEDISKSFQDNMENAILRLVQDNYLKSELAKWYDDFADKMDDGTLSKSERQELEDKYKEIAEKSNAMYKELLETAGIILDDSGEIAKKASKGLQVTASQDSVNEVLGIARNMQMVGLNQEQELIKQTEILSTFGNGFISMQQELQGITSITLESMYYLRDIEKHTKTLNGFGEILTKIEKNTQ